MGLEKNDVIIGLIGVALFFLVYTRLTTTIWDDIYFLIVLILFVVGVVALSGGITGLV